MDAGPNTRTATQVQPNVTPMIDVMLVLLVIFMVVGPVMFNPGFEPVPPRASNIAVYPYQHTDVTLWIDRDGNYYLNKHPIRASVVEPQLSRILRRVRTIGCSICSRIEESTMASCTRRWTSPRGVALGWSGSSPRRAQQPSSVDEPMPIGRAMPCR